MRGQNNTHYLRCGWTMAVESDEVIFGLLSIPFLIIPNIRFAFFLVASEPWADVFIQGSLLNGNSQLRAHHFIMNLGLFFPTCIALCLYTRNFICHFIAQSLSLIRTFCNSSPFTIPTVKNQQEACGSFSSGKVSRVWATQRLIFVQSRLDELLLRFSQDKLGTLREAGQEPAGKQEDYLALLHECAAVFA